MSNETKRNVFGQLLNAYQNLIMKGIQIPDENYRENITTPWNIVYDAAFPDDMPVIPKVVGEILQSAQGQTDLLGVLDTARNVHKVSEPLAWIIANQNTFATAWVLGIWCVEETGEIVKLEAEK